MATEILLNGKTYILKGPIQRTRLQQQIDAVAESSTFSRTKRPGLDTYVFNDWSKGFGTRFIRSGHPEDMKGFFDTSCMTLWPKRVTMQLNNGGLTDPTSQGVVMAVTGSTIFNGSLWVLFRPVDDDTGVVESVIARYLSGVTWTAGGNALTEAAITDKIQAFDLLAINDKLYAIMGLTNDHILRYSTDGATWTAPATTAPPLNLYSNATNMQADQARGARLGYDGVNLVLALHDQQGGEIEVYKSTDGGDTWASVLTRNIKSAQGPTGLKAYRHIDNTIVMYLGTAEGLYIVDIPASGTALAELILPMNGNSNNCMRMETHQGSLYVPVDNGTDAPFGMKKVTVQGDQRRIDDVGLDVSQGVPTDMLGAVRWMKSQGPFLFAAIGGQAASRNSRIIATTGMPDEGWQAVYKNGTANDPFSWFDFSTINLILSQGGEAADSGDTQRLVNILIPTTVAAQHTFETGPDDLQLPEFGGDAPQENGAFLEVQLEAYNLDDDATEFIDFEYGVNGADPTAPSTDIRLDDANRKRALGTSSRGVEARTMRPNLEFNASGGLSVALTEFALLFRKRLASIERFVCTIDMEATSRIDMKRSYEALIDELETVDASRPLVPFVFGQETEKEVEIKSFTYTEETRRVGQGKPERIGGTAVIVLEELL